MSVVNMCARAHAHAKEQRLLACGRRTSDLCRYLRAGLRWRIIPNIISRVPPGILCVVLPGILLALADVSPRVGESFDRLLAVRLHDALQPSRHRHPAGQWVYSQ